MFHETQRFHWLLYAVLAVCGLGVPVAVLAAAPQQAPGVAPILAAEMLLCLAVALFVRLDTEVDGENLRVRLVPFPARVIPLATVRRAEVRTYRPIREYGGWGLKYGPSGMAYNARGNRGVQLELADGKRVLVGSQRPEELLDAIRHAEPALA